MAPTNRSVQINDQEAEARTRSLDTCREIQRSRYEKALNYLPPRLMANPSQPKFYFPRYLMRRRGSRTNFDGAPTSLSGHRDLICTYGSCIPVPQAWKKLLSFSLKLRPIIGRFLLRGIKQRIRRAHVRRIFSETRCIYSRQIVALSKTLNKWWSPSSSQCFR